MFKGDAKCLFIGLLDFYFLDFFYYLGFYYFKLYIIFYFLLAEKAFYLFEILFTDKSIAIAGILLLYTVIYLGKLIYSE